MADHQTADEAGGPLFKSLWNIASLLNAIDRIAGDDVNITNLCDLAQREVKEALEFAEADLEARAALGRASSLGHG